jgi:two-component system chemotaxis response regulator CheB
MAHDIIVIGASAGGVQPLGKIIERLKPDFAGSVFIVLHVSGYSMLPSILAKAGRLAAEHAKDGQPIKPGKILIAPPDHHLLLNDHRVLLSRGPKQNNVRPAIDVLFLSAARMFGPRVIGVVLSGSLDDGSAGLVAIKRAGGIAIVQNPEDAVHRDMPCNAIAAIQADYILPASEIGPALNELSSSNGRAEGSMVKQAKPSQRMKMIARGESDPTVLPKGKISTLTCPECGGTLWEAHEGKVLRFHCHTGHSFSAGTMLETQQNGVETALWVALRTLKERAVLLNKLAGEARRGHRRFTERKYTEDAKEFEQRAELLREVLMSRWPKPSRPALKSRRTSKRR